MKAFSHVGFLVLLLAAAGAWAQPDIYCAEPVYDFGQYDNTEKVVHAFVIENRGDEPLTIKNVSASCGCTVAELEKDALEPGESTKVSTTLSLARRQGKQNKTITVFSNDPDAARYQLRLTGEAVAAIMVEPRALSFGDVKPDAAVTQELTVSAGKDEVSFNITSIESTQNLKDLGLTADFEPIAEGKEYRVKVAVDPKGVSPQRYSGQVTINTDNADYPKIPVTAVLNVLGPVNVVPTRIHLRENDEPGRVVTQYVRVQPGSVSEFKVTKVEPPLEQITYEVTDRGNSVYIIKMENIPLTKEMNGTKLVIHTDAADAEPIEVPFAMISIPTPGPKQ